MVNVPPALGSPKELKRRADAAWKTKGLWEGLLSEAYSYCLPQRNTFFGERTQGQKKDTLLFDSTAPLAISRFASRAQALIMPPWRRWSKIVPGPELEDSQRKDTTLQGLLGSVTERVFRYINRSNFATQIGESLKDFGVSALAMKVVELPVGDPGLFTCEAVPLSEIAPELGPHGTIETVWRRPRCSIRNLERMYPGVELAQDLKEAKLRNADDEHTFDEGVIFEPEAKRFHGVLIHKDEAVLWHADYGDSSPWIVPTADRTAGEVLGRGPAIRCLADIKTLNKVKEFLLRAAAFRVAGVWTSTDESILNPLTARIIPGVVIPVESNDQRAPTLRALEFGGNPDMAQIIIENLQAGIREAFYNTAQRPEGPVQTATFEAIQDRELLQNSGTEFGRLDNEFAQRFIARVVHVLAKRGKIPPLRVDGRVIALEPQSPLARAQDMDDLMAMSRGFEVLTGFLGQEVTALGIKVEDVPEEVWRLVGADMALVRSPDEREQMQTQVAQIVASQQMAEQAATTQAGANAATLQ